MDSTAIGDHLASIFPELAERFAVSDFRDDDGALTCCGAFAECSHFVRERLADLSPAQLSRLGSFISECMSASDGEVDTAAAACFLENLAYEPAAEALAPFLSGRAIWFLRQCDVA
jgi:hypothetical protein